MFWLVESSASRSKSAAIDTLKHIGSESHSLNKIVSDAVNNIAQNIMFNGQFAYEIHYDYNNNPFLIHLTDENVFEIPFYLVQYVPKSYRWKKNKTFILLRKRNTFVLEFPHELGGKRRLNKIFSKLDRCDLHKSKAISNFQNTYSKTIDLSLYSEYMNYLVERATKIFGWNRRDFSTKYKTEFYIMYKQISFKWAQSIIREKIVMDLNRLLTKLNINAAIKIEGIPSSKDLDQLRVALTQNKIRLEAIDNKIWF